MGQLDEADSQYKRALELEPSSAAIKGEAQLVDMIRSNLKLGQECLQAGDARCILRSYLTFWQFQVLTNVLGLFDDQVGTSVPGQCSYAVPDFVAAPMACQLCLLQPRCVACTAPCSWCAEDVKGQLDYQGAIRLPYCAS